MQNSQRKEKQRVGGYLDLALTEEFDGFRGRQLATGDGVNDVRDNPPGIWAIGGARASGGRSRAVVVVVEIGAEGPSILGHVVAEDGGGCGGLLRPI